MKADEKDDFEAAYSHARETYEKLLAECSVD